MGALGSFIEPHKWNTVMGRNNREMGPPSFKQYKTIFKGIKKNWIKMKKTVFALILVISCFASKTFSQDKVSVYLLGGGVHGEKFKVKYVKNDSINFKLKGYFKQNFEISTADIKPYRQVPIYIYRKPFLGLFYRKVTVLRFVFEPGYKYLFLYRDFGRKGKFSFDFKWSNEYLEELEFHGID